MKKLLAILLGGAMFASALAGMVACKDDHEHVDVDPKDGKCDVCGETMTEPGPGPGPEKPTISRRADPRTADAFEAYDYAGTKIGGFKTIAEAINAVVEADLDHFEDDSVAKGTEGGYVVRKGETQKIFFNKKGYTEENDEQFWYYQDGNALAGYNCWDDKNLMTSIEFLRDQKMVAHQVASYGLASTQTWNGFTLLDEHGQVDKESNTPASWVFSSPMDTGVIAFPSAATAAGANGTGMSKANYKLDLSEVKITPAYEGEEDPVYAFVGFYIWNPEYVLAVGIACDTTTGQWYQFNGSSRNDSFSDVEYEVGECLMESTWNKDGYFTPDGTDVTMTIQTVKHVDEEYDEEYFTSELEIAIAGGKTMKLIIDDEFVAPYSTKPVNIWNDYMFIAGLDIKNKVVSGTKVENTDYFNGAKFEGLCVTEAGIYFPTEDELSDLDYAAPLPAELRGKTFDLLLANDVESEGLYAYTIVNNCAFANYESKDGADYYSFKFDGDPVGETALGGELKDYQDQVNSLNNMTVANFQDYEELYEEVGTWYGQDDAHTGSILTAFHLNLLDFAAYKKAQSVYLEAMNVSDEGKAVLEKLNKLNICTAASYPFLDWEAPEDAESISGYIWSEAQEFAKIREDFKKLSSEEQGKVIRLSDGGQDNFDAWEEFYDSVSEYLANETYTSKIYHVGNMEMTGEFEDLNGKDALIRIIKILYRGITNWLGTRPNDPASEANVMNSDSQTNFKYNFHIIYLIEKMKEADVEVPAFVDTLVALVTSTDRSEGFLSDIKDYIYPVLSKIGEIYDKQQKGTYVWLDKDLADFVNKYMVGVGNWKEAGFNWNWGNGKKGIRDRLTNYEYYFGLPNGETEGEDDLEPTLKILFDIVTTCDPNAVISENGRGFDAAVTPLTEDPSTHGSEQAVAVLDKIKALKTLEGYEYKGWTAPEEATETAGYLYTELTAFRTLVNEREALGAADKAYVTAQLGNTENEAVAGIYGEWTKLSDELTALATHAVWEKTFTTFAKATGKETKVYKAEEALAELINVAYQITTVGLVADSNDSAKVGGLDVDSNFNSSARLVSFYDFFMTNEAPLPTYVKTMTDALGVPAYYDNFFYPLSRMVQLAVRVNTAPITKIEEFTDADMQFLNKYWVSGYKMEGLLATHWWAGPAGSQKYFGWIAWKLEEQFTAMLGGTIEGKKIPSDYAGYINDLLSKSGYGINEATHNWGVTAEKIESVTYSADVLAFIEKFDKLGNLNTYTAKGWKAPEGEEVTGYLYSEAQFFTTAVKVAYEALGEDDKDAATAYTAGNYDDWKALSEAVLALDEGKAALQIQAADSDAEKAQAKTYTVGEALGELLAAIAKVNAVGEKLCFDNGIDKGVSFRPYFFYFALKELQVEIPSVITERMDAVKMDAESAQKFEEDVKYIITIMKIAKAINADSAHKLTAAEIAMVNESLVGKAKFVDGGFNYAYTVDTAFGEPVSWHGNSKGYKVYFGFDTSKEFSHYQKLVINYLVTEYKATALKYDNASATDENVMGITEAIAAPAAE